MCRPGDRLTSEMNTGVGVGVGVGQVQDTVRSHRAGNLTEMRVSGEVAS